MITRYLPIIACALIAGSVVNQSVGYGLMSGHDIGAGFFPAVLAALLGVISIWLALENAPPPRNERASTRSVLLVPLSILVFALAIVTVGLVGAVIVTVVTASIAIAEFSIRRTAILAVAVTAIIVVIFPVLLRAQLPIFRMF